MTNINNLIKRSIIEKLPFSIGKMGSVESTCLYNYHIYNGSPNWDTAGHGWTLRKAISIQAGVYPDNNDTLNKWCSLYLNSLVDLDHCLIWCPEYGDEFIVDRYCYKTKKFFSFSEIEPWFIEDSWIQSLNNKKILVISPFKKTIEKQAAIFNQIWPKYSVKFSELTVIKTGFSFTEEGKTSSYFKQLDKINQEILNRSEEYDVALLGCGAYAIPLMSTLKFLGIPSIHLGGSLQLLFGIKGSRWDNSPEFQNSEFYNNKFWTRPLKIDIPENRHLIEQGCYW